MDTLGSKVCELMGSGNATVNKDVFTLGKKNTWYWYRCGSIACV